MDIKELLKEISQEAQANETPVTVSETDIDAANLPAGEEVQVVADPEAAAEDVLQEGELLDGTPVSGEKEESVVEMMGHAEKARDMSRQLTELADKADEILHEDKVHLVNEIATEAFQMNYRHIMEHAELADAVVTFESSNKVSELNYLSNEARKMAILADNLESRIMDFSPEGKILSFFRRDKAKIKRAMDQLAKLENPGKEDRTVELKHKKIFLFLMRDDKVIEDLEVEIKKEVEILLRGEKELEEIVDKVHGLLKAGKPSSDFKPMKMKIFDEKLLGSKVFSSTDAKAGKSLGARVAGGAMQGLGAWAAGQHLVTFAMLPKAYATYKGTLATVGAAVSMPAFAAIAGAGLVLSISLVYFGQNIATKEEKVNVEFGDFAKMRTELEKLVKVLNHDRFEAKFTEMEKLVNAIEDKEDKQQYKSLMGAFANVAELIYEHSFFVIENMGTLTKSVKK